MLVFHWTERRQDYVKTEFYLILVSLLISHNYDVGILSGQKGDRIMWTESTQDTLIAVLSSLFLAKESAGVFFGQQGDRIVWTESRQDCLSSLSSSLFLTITVLFSGNSRETGLCGQKVDKIVCHHCLPPYFLQLQCYFLGRAGGQDCVDRK